MWLRKTHPGVAVSLIVGCALLLSGGVSAVMVKPGSMKVSKPGTMEVSKQELLGVSHPETQKISKPRTMKAGVFVKGKFIRPERENPAYDRCAKRKGFDEQRKCALEALGISPEESN